MDKNYTILPSHSLKNTKKCYNSIIMKFWEKTISSKIRPNNQFGRILNLTSRYFAIFGGFILLFAALISIFSIFGRVVFSSPILGDFELVEIACAVAIGSFLPLCHLKNGNVIVDFITAKLSKNKINLLDSISSLIFAVVALFFSSRMILGARDMYIYQEETMLLAFPIWLPFLPVIASFFGMASLGISGTPGTSGAL